MNLEYNKKNSENKSAPTSDEKLQLITGQIFVGQAILVAHKLGLFKVLSKKPIPIQNIASLMGLHERSVQAMISSACALSLIEYVDEGYQLSEIGKTYLDQDSTTYYGKVLDLLIEQNEIMNYSSIKNAILSNKSQVSNGDDLFCNNSNLSNGSNFIDSLHYKAFKPAFHWPKITDLSQCKKIVDLGGGSGIHTIAACSHNIDLLGIICDRDKVIPHTAKHVENFDLASRIDLKALDIWNDAYPDGDIYFLGDIFHDWPREKCNFLAKKCFQHLPANGRIILHEMLFNDEKTGPFLTAAYNMKMLTWTEGQQFSRCEIEDILKEAGFVEITIQQSLGNWSLITGIKK